MRSAPASIARTPLVLGRLPADAAPAVIAGEPPADGLLERLARALEANDVAYCQWKGHRAAHRWSTGLGDVDLLVDHDAATDFRSIAGGLGFKLVRPAGERQIPGVESYFGHDPVVRRPLHIHVHYRLVLGDYWRTTYRIPIERLMLDTAVAGSVFRVPDPTYQFLVFVLRMVLQQRGRLRLSTRARWLRGIQIQLDDLEGHSDRVALTTLLTRYLPSVDLPFFQRCVRSLRGECGPLERSMVSLRLHNRLRPHSRRPPLSALLAATIEKVLPLRARRMMLADRMGFAAGGSAIALIGGDGAGKSTCARELVAWLSADCPTMHAHLGNPPRSLLTLAVGGALKAEQALDRLQGHDSRPGSLIELLRHLCTARDCYRLYQEVSRFAARGGIAICERYPVPENRVLVGPRIPALLSANPSALAGLLRNLEVSYYERILPPDQLFVLRLDPELAVLRKPDEPGEYVRTRGRVVWETDWSTTLAHVIDASRPLPEVLSDIKSLAWSAL